MRPGRGSRPRTKNRPAHRDAVSGWVTTVDRGRYTCRIDKSGAGTEARAVTAMRARELRRASIVVGDRVDIVGDISGLPGSLARIVRISERSTILRRSADDTDPTERIVVANADALLIVTAVADPQPRVGFIDRCLVAAYAGGLHPMLLITKSDLADPAVLAEAYRDLDVTVLTSGRIGDTEPLDTKALSTVRNALDGHMTALIGHSGVGKSTLVNALVPHADRATGDVTGVGKGRHTSSSAIALALPGGGWIIDTPGVRSFGLAHVDVGELLTAFDDLAPATADCPPGCDHHGPGIGCALDDAVAADPSLTNRLHSLRRLLASRHEPLA